METRQFELHYQPQLDCRNGRIVGVEALLRWRHPHEGLVLPTEFIPVAGETGMILPLGEWVLDPEHTGSAGCDRTCRSPFKWAIAILD